MDTNYNFPVALQPIYLADGQKIAKRQAVVRTDTMKTLGLVSDDYGLVKHATVIDAFREAGQKYNVKEKIFLVNNGATLFYRMTFPKVEMEVVKGDIIRMQMIVKNSYGTGVALRVIFGAMRLVCTNGLILGKQFLQFVYRHIGNVKGLADGVEIKQFKQAYVDYIKLFNDRMPVIQAMSKKQISDGATLFEPDKIAFPKYLREESKLAFESGKDHSVWGYYNSFTYAISHKMKKESPILSIEYGKEAWRVAERLVN